MLTTALFLLIRLTLPHVESLDSEITVETQTNAANVTYMDLSGPADPEAQFPIVALKRSL